MTLFNVWHFITLGVIFIFFVVGVISSLKQSNKKLVAPMIFSVALITTLIAGFSIVVVDKYTKIVKLYKMENKRLLSIEKIVYTGIVKNEGNHEIGKVTFEIKLVNKGHVTGNIKGENFYRPSGFFDFFSGKSMLDTKPQTVTKKFVVAKNLRPGEAKSFRVHFDYPPYFRSVAQFSEVYGH